ncbi:hypothetical protein H2203_003455 [Taxawa tesnikishii (nom. ined.)]|nr:hypothetical protein H2203_003455 [Dothideales sp. JES 119]
MAEKKDPINVETTSVAPSETSESDLSRFTATGRPMPKHAHDPYTSIMAGGTFSTAGANTLPIRFTDDSIITVPINLADLNDGADNSNGPVAGLSAASKKEGSWISRKLRSGKSKEASFISVKMTRRDYLQHWAKGEDGKYLEGVVEPPGGRREWAMGKWKEQ